MGGGRVASAVSSPHSSSNTCSIPPTSVPRPSIHRPVMDTMSPGMTIFGTPLFQPGPNDVFSTPTPREIKEE